MINNVNTNEICTANYRLILLFLLLLGILLHQSVALCAEMKDGGTIFYTEPVKAVIFKHSIHNKAIGISCEECHPEPFNVKVDYRERNDFNMKEMSEGKYCGLCHNGKRAFSVQSRCTACHIGVIGYNRMYDAGSLIISNTESGEN